MNLTFAPVYHNHEKGDRKFKIGKFRELNIYGVEIVDTTGEASKDEFLLGGCDVLLMGLTEDEFMLKDTNTKKLCDLIDNLVKDLPRDRLLSFKQLNFKGEVTDKKIEARCQTTDDGKYQNFVKSGAIYIPDDIAIVVGADYYLAANFYTRTSAAPKELLTAEFKKKRDEIRKITIKKLRAMPEFFCVYNKSLGDDYPTIGPSGAIWVFTMEDLAKDIIAKNPDVDLEYKKITPNEMIEITKDMYRLGIKEILTNPGYDFALSVKREEFFSIEQSDKKYIANSDLHAVAIHFLQNKHINIENCQKAADELWKIFIQKLAQGLFLTPILFESDKANEKIEDKKLHYTDTAYEIITNNDITFWDMEDFDQTPQKENKDFRYITLKASAKGQDDQLWLPVFTDIKELRKVINQNIRIGVATVAELNKAAKNMTGICINPKGINLKLEISTKQKNQ